MMPDEIKMAAARGWSVIPVRLDKRPSIPTWKPYQTNRPNPHELTTWAATNPPAWAVITGAVSGLIIIDFDGEAGRETMRRLNISPHIRTGSGGFHWYVRHPGRHVPTLNAKAKRDLGESLPGCDIRGDGGYAVFHGRNTSGAYVVLRPSLEPDPFEKIPPSLLPFLTVHESLPSTSGGGRPQQPPPPDFVAKALAQVPAQGRNNAGFWLACQLRDAGISQAQGEAIMEDYAGRVPATNTKGQPERYTAAEARASLRAAYSSPAREAARKPGTTPRVALIESPPAALPMELCPPENDEPPPGVEADERAFHRTDLGNAERLRRKFGRQIRYCHAWEFWLMWDGRRWTPDANGQVMRYARDTVRAIFNEAAKETDGDKRKEIIKWAMESESRSRLSAMVALAENLEGISVTPDELDRGTFYLNCNNGTVDLRTGAIHVHRRGDLITKLAPVNYDPTAKAPDFAAFLDQITCGRASLAEYLQRVIGYASTGEVTEKALFVLYGHGDNGKTTFVELFAAALGDYATQIPIEALMLSRNQSSGREASPELANLKGRRFVTSSEADDGQRLNEAKVKHLTGMGRIMARFLHKDPFEFAPTHKLLIDANYKPSIKGQDKGIWSRLRLVPFDLALTADKIDRSLRARLIERELPGILAWIVSGARTWFQGGLAEPAEITVAVDAYRAQMDILGRFLEDCTAKTPEAATPANLVYKVYLAWAKESHEHEWSERVFSERMQERGMERKRRSLGVFYLNLTLKRNFDPQTNSLSECMDVGSCSDIDVNLNNPRGLEERYGGNPSEPTLLHDDDEKELVL